MDKVSVTSQNMPLSLCMQGIPFKFVANIQLDTVTVIAQNGFLAITGQKETLHNTLYSTPSKSSLHVFCVVFPSVRTTKVKVTVFGQLKHSYTNCDNIDLIHFLQNTIFLQSLHFLYFMSLDRHGCKLQLDWLADEYNHEAVILVAIPSKYIKITGDKSSHKSTATPVYRRDETQKLTADGLQSHS